MSTLCVTPFTFDTADGGSVTVPGSFDRPGNLVVHRAQPGDDSREWKRIDGWVVSHRWSGLQIGTRRTKKQALELRRALSSIGSHAWSFTDPGTVDVAALRKLVAIVIDGASLHYAR
jgi:hypothetical protein